MQFNGLADQLQHFATRLTDGNAARQVRDVCPVAGLSLFHYDEVFHDSAPTLA
jgi:hypothetical protein